MARPMTLVILSASMMALSLAQTFQYSRGWTNGKRAGNNPSQFLAWPGLPADFGGTSLSGVQVANAGANPIIDMPTPCQIKKLKMFLRGTAGADQLYLMPCEILETPGAAGLPSMSDLSPAGRFRRSSSSSSSSSPSSSAPLETNNKSY